MLSYVSCKFVGWGALNRVVIEEHGMAQMALYDRDEQGAKSWYWECAYSCATTYHLKWRSDRLIWDEAELPHSTAPVERLKNNWICSLGDAELKYR